jgi:hypothetical protein
MTERYRGRLEVHTVPISNLPFEDCSFTTAETLRILGCSKTFLFDGLLRNGELESYLDGTRRKITGSSIEAYRRRKLQERQRRSMPQLENRKTKRKTAGEAPAKRQQGDEANA